MMTGSCQTPNTLPLSHRLKPIRTDLVKRHGKPAIHSSPRRKTENVTLITGRLRMLIAQQIDLVYRSTSQEIIQIPIAHKAS